MSDEIDGCGICGDLGHNAWECPNQKPVKKKIEGGLAQWLER